MSSILTKGLKLFSGAVLAAGLLAGSQAMAAEHFKEPMAPKEGFSFEGPFGTFDQAQLQRGYKVYREVCSSCHSMKLMSFRNLGQKGGPFYDPKYKNPNDNPIVKQIASEYDIPTIDPGHRRRHDPQGYAVRYLPVTVQERRSGQGVEQRYRTARPVGDDKGPRRWRSLRLLRHDQL